MKPELMAGLGAATTGVTSVTAWLADLEIYLRVGVAFVGIVVGVLTALYYYEAWQEKRRKRA